MSDTLSGLVALGVTTTQLFDGEESRELIFLDLGTGGEFNLPISEQQLSMIAGYMAGVYEDGDLLDGEGFVAHEEDPEEYVEPAEARVVPIREVPESGAGSARVGEVSADDLRSVTTF